MPMLFTVCALLGCGLLLLTLLGSREQVQPFAGRSALHPGSGRLVSFAAFFGLGGVLASWLGFGEPLQLVFALLSGLAVGGFTAFALRLRGEQDAWAVSHVGCTGQILRSPQDTPPHDTAPGETLLTVRLTTAGQSEDLLARSSDPLYPGDWVLVTGEHDRLLDVRRWDGR